VPPGCREHRFASCFEPERRIWYRLVQMSWLASSWPLFLVALIPGCNSCAKSRSAATDSNPAAITASIDASQPTVRRVASESAAVFSAPIAAMYAAHRQVVAGLVVSVGMVRVTSVDSDTDRGWTTDLLPGVSWRPDAELHLLPAGNGVAVVWHGPRDGAVVHAMVLLGPRGEPVGEPIEVGGAYCATLEAVAWIEPRSGGAATVRALRWADSHVFDVVSVPADRDPSLVCGDHAVLVLGAGDDDLVATSVVMLEPGASRNSIVAIREADFGDDDEREHEAYSFGDSLGLVWVGTSGTIWLREVPNGGSPTPWHSLKHALGDDDDIVAVDGDADATVVVYTHDSGEPCPDPNGVAESVRAIRVDRRTHVESRLELVGPSCDRASGPFWIGFIPGAAVVGWVERETLLPAGSAPIGGISFRAIAGDTVRAARLDRSADAAVDAGCDNRGCAVASLVRKPPSDGMHPEAIDLFYFP